MVRRDLKSKYRKFIVISKIIGWTYHLMNKFHISELYFISQKCLRVIEYLEMQLFHLVILQQN